MRGVLPASTLSHVGIFASGQAYEQLLLRLMASPLPEAREFGDMVLTELAKVIPSFVGRIERPDRGGEWIAYLRERRLATERAVARLGLDRRAESDAPSVELVGVEGGEEDLLAASLFESAGASETQIRDRIEALDPLERAELIGELAGERRNRRHRPGRGWEAVRYRFEIVSDYGGFRDLQRHRMLTCQWQRLGPDLGAGVPEEVRDAGAGPEYERALEISRREFERLEDRGPRRGRPLRALPRLPDPLRARPQRARGHAPDRASLRPRGTPDLPRRRPGHVRADRGRPPGDRSSHDSRGLLPRAAPGAHPGRDPHAPQAPGCDSRVNSGSPVNLIGLAARMLTRVVSPQDSPTPAGVDGLARGSAQARGSTLLIGVGVLMVCLAIPATLVGAQAPAPAADPVVVPRGARGDAGPTAAA